MILRFRNRPLQQDYDLPDPSVGTSLSSVSDSGPEEPLREPSSDPLLLEELSTLCWEVVARECPGRRRLQTSATVSNYGHKNKRESTRT